MEKTIKEKKPKKVINHRILEINPILGMILLTIVAFVLVTYVFGVAMGGVTGMVAYFSDNTLPMPVLYVAYSVFAFVMLAIHKRWFYPEFESNIKPAKDFGKWLLIAFACLLAIIIPDLIVMLATGAHYVAPTVQTLAVALMAGTTEEVIFRAVPGSFGMRQAKEPKDIVLVVLVTSLLFSLVHATNLLSGADLTATLTQLVSSFGTGVLLCALFLRSGSILPPMLVHFLIDVYAMMNSDVVTDTGLMEAKALTRDVVINLVLSAIQIAIGVYLLRKSVRGDVMTVWEKKWDKKKEAPKAEISNEAEVG